MMLIDTSMASDLLMEGLKLTGTAYGGTMAARTALAATGRWLGAFPPELYSRFCWLPWRPVAREWLKFSDWLAERHHGKKATADFAGP